MYLINVPEFAMPDVPLILEINIREKTKWQSRHWQHLARKTQDEDKQSNTENQNNEQHGPPSKTRGEPRYSQRISSPGLL
jgi:hypothetical protein